MRNKGYPYQFRRSGAVSIFANVLKIQNTGLDQIMLLNDFFNSTYTKINTLILEDLSNSPRVPTLGDVPSPNSINTIFIDYRILKNIKAATN